MIAVIITMAVILIVITGQNVKLGKENQRLKDELQQRADIKFYFTGDRVHADAAQNFSSVKMRSRAREDQL